MITKYQIKGEKTRIKGKPAILYVGTAEELKKVFSNFSSNVTLEEKEGSVHIGFKRGSKMVDLMHLFMEECRKSAKDETWNYTLALGQCMENLIKMGGDVLG